MKGEGGGGGGVEGEETGTCGDTICNYPKHTETWEDVCISNLCVAAGFKLKAGFRDVLALIKEATSQDSVESLIAIPLRSPAILKHLYLNGNVV